MIYKNKEYYYTRNRNNIDYNRGRKIQVKDLIFHVDDKLVCTEYATGLLVPYNKHKSWDKLNKEKKLIVIESEMIRQYDRIFDSVKAFIKGIDNYSFDEVVPDLRYSIEDYINNLMEEKGGD